MKNVLVGLVGMMLVGIVWADSDHGEVLKRLLELEGKVTDLQRHISERGVSREEVSDLVRQELDRTVDTAAWAQSKDASPVVALSDQIAQFGIKGDLRVRYEQQERRTGVGAVDQTRGRFRTRLRLEGSWQTHEGWEVVVGVATGYSNGGGSGASPAISTNDTWSQDSPFESGNLYLDYAYAKHTWEGEGSSFTLTLGQQKNPFVMSNVFWSVNVRPAGITGTYKAGGLFATVGGYEVLWGGRDQTSSQLGAAQIGWAGELVDGVKGQVATAYYYYNAATSDTSGPSVVPATLDPDYMFEIGDLYGALDTTVGDVKVGLWGHVWRNFGAESDVAGLGTTGQLGTQIMTKDADDMETGYAWGLKLGVSRYSFGYTYAHVEADSMLETITDTDFGSTGGVNETDVKGHRLSGKVNLTKNLSLGLTYIEMESIDDDDPRESDLLRFDALYKF